jgi:AGCS family alanine or glycine:cation symporter
MEIINKYLWLLTTTIILLISIYLTIKENFPQLQWKKIFTSLKNKSQSNISTLECLMMSLASRIGVGSIAGIALAIKYGGIGCIFWIWIITILISSISYVESYYGSKYKEKKDNIYQSGPHYYLNKELNNKKLSKIYALLMFLAYGIGFIIIQSNTISIVTTISTEFDIHIINIIIVLVCAYCIYSNNKTKLVSKIVPFMTFFYLILGLYVMINNIEIVKQLLIEIIISAFKLNSIKGGLIFTIIIGMQRAIFSTEVAIGTAAISSGMIESNKEGQGYLQILGNYITTFIICTTTALIILTSNYNTYINEISNGIELTLYAFEYHFQTMGKIFINILIFLFAISTVISGFYYGQTSLKYLTNDYKINNFYKIFLILFILISTYISSTTIWTIIDILVSILCLINLYAIIKIYIKGIK